MFLSLEGNYVVLHREIQTTFGLKVHIQKLRWHCEGLRKALKASIAPSRYETAPGQQMQIDFGEKKIFLGEELVKVHFFVAILGYSRRIFVKAYISENQGSWLDGIESAFYYFGGVPTVLLSDNTKSLVTSHSRRAEAV